MGSDLIYDIDTRGGYAELTRHSPGSHVASLRLRVYSDVQRRGVGRDLVRQAVELAGQNGIHRIEATPYTDNPGSTAFFQALPDWHYEGRREAGGRRGRCFVDTHLFAWVSATASRPSAEDVARRAP